MDEALSCFSYPINAAHILQKKKALKKLLLQRQGLTEKKIALLSGSTIGEIKPVLELFLLYHGIKPVFFEGGYHLFFEDLAFGNPDLDAFAPDIIYIHTSNRNLTRWPAPTAGEQEAGALADAEMSRFEKAWQGAEKYQCPVIQNNFEAPSYRLLGNRDCVLPGGRIHYINECNRRMASYAAAHPHFYIQDIHYLSGIYGLDNWCDESQWYLYKYALSTSCIPYLCQNLASIIKSLLGKNHKSVVTDLDGTLWGGIIGDDGSDGIVLGAESPAGMAYSAFQAYLKELAELGVVLNVASKNEEALALEGFSRPDSILKREDFLCFKANWEPKSQSLSAIAQELNLLPESFVFIDDNPAEREIVRRELPGVAVPELDGPESYIRALDRGGYFEVTALSEDDKKRNDMYRQNFARQKQQAAFTDYGAYLQSLDMTAQITPFTKEKLERITQLINKTNQFNLTTRRYTAAELAALSADSSYLTLAGSLADKFGDNGLVSALIGRRETQVLVIELWIMSCRVFKRELEYTMFDELVRRCKAAGIKIIEGIYYPTRKNLLVADFYATMGFDKIRDTQAERRYRFTIPEAYQPRSKAIRVEREKGDGEA